MDVMEAIYSRRSVRAYTDQPVSRETLEMLMEAAVQAPTAMNQQPWAFGVIQGEKLAEYSTRTKAYLLEHIDQFPWIERYRDYFTNPNSSIFHGASAVVIIFASPQAVTADTDCAMAALNLMLAARAQGLGTCWIGFFSFLLGLPEVMRELGVPEDYRAVAPIAVGYPKADMPPVPKAPPQMLFWHE